MGAGCSSPLRKFGGARRNKNANRRDSSSYDVRADSMGQHLRPSDEQKAGNLSVQAGAASSLAASSGTSAGESAGQKHQKKIAPEKEITIQSETNDDHPSSASYYTEIKQPHNAEETALAAGEHAARVTPKSLGTESGANTATTTARILSFNATHFQHDRHLLVSPALSPAPSTCYSPSPASSSPGCSTPIDLNDLSEIFKTITFGSPCNENQQRVLQQQQQQQQVQSTTNRIKQPERPQSELHNLYTQQLIQSQNDLIDYITVIFITADSSDFNSNNCQESQSSLKHQNFIIETLAHNIEINLKTFCDEHLFNLKFLNLSQAHLSDHFHINNLLDVSMQILEQEYRENGQRLVIIILSNTGSAAASEAPASSSVQQASLARPISSDKKHLLPTRIEAQSMNKLLASSNLEEQIKDLIKKWYNQVGGTFYLNPIYAINSKIVSITRNEREEAWQSWNSESSAILNEFIKLQELEPELFSKLNLKTFFESYLDFLTREPSLQKRTLLIKNLSTPVPLNQNQPVQTLFNDLVRLLSDPNKLTLKRPLTDEEFTKTISDWVSENFAKFVESFIENRIVHGKHVPPFVEPKLFIELTRQRHCLEFYLDSKTESFETKCREFYDNHLSSMLRDLASSSSFIIDENQTTSQQSPSYHHMVFISGPQGCGKSLLFAQIVRYAVQDLFNQAQIIYRFSGVSLDSRSPNRLLRSICEQFCQTQGENVTAASYIYSARKEIIGALNKIIKMQISLILLDGLDIFYDDSAASEPDLNWLCEIEADPRIKMIIMLETDSALYKKVLSCYSDATFISLDHPSLSEWAQMLTTVAKSSGLLINAALYDDIKESGVGNQNPPEDTRLTYSDAINIINLSKIRRLNNESIFPELNAKFVQNLGFKKIYQNILAQIEYLVVPYQLGGFIISLSTSRNGLSDSDIIGIMSMISQARQVAATDSEQCKFSSTLLSYVKTQLRPWLRFLICDNVVKTQVHKNLVEATIKRYASGPNAMFSNIVQEVREILYEYFSRHTRSKVSKASIFRSSSDTNAVDLRDSVSPHERIWLSTQTSEIINLLIQMNPVKAREHLLNKQRFFARFLYSTMPEEFIEDYERLKDVGQRKSSASSTSGDELATLVGYIRKSVYPLRYDGSQIFSQVYCHAFESVKTGKTSKNKKLNEILSSASCPPTRSLLPVSEQSINSFIRARIGQQSPAKSTAGNNSTLSLSSSTSNTNASATGVKSASLTTTANRNSYQQQQQQQAALLTKQRIFTIKDNHRHVIVIYPDRGCLSVWDIYEERAVRTIHDLDSPKDLRMIDQKRAIILCNRELRVYDLDAGVLLTKLKGVMNQKMPFFEVFGENYVVALARNRMYVNMLNLNTGELETTFKVGEDRFLNSLLVSANGGICVCGDETQKPFPLLVWDLNERRLLYDLRLDRHEFLTKMSAISDDGHFVVSVCRQLGDSSDPLPHNTNSSSGNSGASVPSVSSGKSAPNFIVIYDLNSGTLFKKWKPGLDSCSVAISLSADQSGKVINTIVDSSILVWDLATGSKRHTLIGHSSPADVIRVQNNRLFSMDSTCRDQSLRIWDIEEGNCMAVFSPDAPVNCCQISIRGDALVCAFAAETRLSTLVVCKNETVNDVVKRNKRRKSSKTLYVFDEPSGRKLSS